MGVLFFFQAEDGIRDADVTGVQTCALPICGHENVYAGRPSWLPIIDDPRMNDLCTQLRCSRERRGKHMEEYVPLCVGQRSVWSVSHLYAPGFMDPRRGRHPL